MGGFTDKEIISYSLPDIALNVKSIRMFAEEKYRGTHSHSAMELVKVNEGMAVCCFTKNDVPIFKGEILVINPFTVHELKTNDECEITYIQTDIFGYINRKKLGAINEYILMNKAMPYIKYDENSEVHSLFERIKNEAETANCGAELYIKSYVFALLASMTRSGVFPEERMFPDKEIYKILPCVEYVEKNYKEKIYLDDIAKATGTDKFQLCKAFKSFAGNTIIDFINFVRLRKAEELLMEGNFTVSQIALDCGFSSIQYFNKVFKSHFACSPKAYKKFIRR